MIALLAIALVPIVTTLGGLVRSSTRLRTTALCERLLQEQLDTCAALQASGRELPAIDSGRFAPPAEQVRWELRSDTVAPLDDTSLTLQAVTLHVFTEAGSIPVSRSATRWFPPRDPKETK